MNRIQKKLSGILLVVLFLWGWGQLFGQCTGCSITLNANTSTAYTVNAGSTLCVNPGVTATGNIRLNGGTVCNNGTLTNMTFLSGTFNNYNTFSSSTAITAAINGLCRINNYANSTFSVNAGFNLAATTAAIQMILNVEKSSRFSVLSSSNTRGILTVSVGVNGVASGTVPTVFEVQSNFAVNRVELALINETNATTRFLGMSGFNNGSPKRITNRGNLVFGSAVTVGGDGGGNGTFELNNLSVCTFSDTYSTSMTNGTVSIVNDGTLTAMSNITMNGVNHNFTNNRLFNGTFDLKLDRSVIVNTGTLTSRDINAKITTITNSKRIELTRSFITSHSLAVVNNNNYIKATTDFSVGGGTVNLGQGSLVYTGNYYNTGTGATVTGPVSAPTLTSYPRLIVTGTSQNTQLLRKYVIFYDQSLVASSGNLNYGIDNVSNPSLIEATVLFGSRSLIPVDVPVAVNNCTVLGNAYLLQAAANNLATVTIGCIGQSVDLVTGFNYSLSAPFPASPNPSTTTTYTWQPGNLPGYNPAVAPLVTTVYTANATYNNCIYTATCQVVVNAPPLPVISYGSSTLITAPANPSGTSFTPTLAPGPTGGVYSYVAAPGNTLNLNTATGVITAAGSSLGTYTVIYTIGPPTFSCNYTNSVVVTVNDNLCNLAINAAVTSLCHGDQFQITVTTPPSASYTWSPSTGLSCVNCTSPLLTYTAGGPLAYTLTVFNNGYWCGDRTFRIEPINDCPGQNIIGCCFSNYGAGVYISDAGAHLNVYCNVLNEISGLSLIAPSTYTYDKGRVESEGNLNASMEWINNGQNTMYVLSPTLSVQQGTTSLIGYINQNIKGNSVTRFNRLNLLGNGQRVLMIDAIANSDLDVSSNELVIQQYNFLMKNPNSNIYRTSGFASTAPSGYFSRYMASQAMLPNKAYGYPLGASANGTISPYRYRPLELFNNSTVQSDEVSANFINVSPSFQDADFTNPNAMITNTLTDQSPVITQRNQLYYHKIKNTQANAPLSDIYVRSYYPSTDGSFYGLGEWEPSPGLSTYWWGPTPGSAGSSTPVVNGLANGLVYAVANGTFNFNGKPFSLASTGFSINTSGYGSGSGGLGNVVTLNPVPTPTISVGTSSSTTSSGSGSVTANNSTTLTVNNGVTSSTTTSTNGSATSTVTSVSTTSGNSTNSTVTVTNGSTTTVSSSTSTTGPGGVVTATQVTTNGTGTVVTTSTTQPTSGGVGSSTVVTVSGGVTTTSISTTVNNGNAVVNTTTINTVSGSGTVTTVQSCTTVPVGASEAVTCNTYTLGMPGSTVVTTYTNSTSPTNTISPGNPSNPYGPGNNSIPGNPMASTYELNISSANSCDLPGKVRFTITPNGTISPSSVQFVDPVTNQVLGELSDEAYAINNVSLSISLNPSPPDLLASCVNSISILTSTLGDYVLDKAYTNPTEVVVITVPTMGGQLQLLNGTSGITVMDYSGSVSGYSVVQAGPGVFHLSAGTLAAGVYEISFVVDNGAMSPSFSRTIKGQIIIK